MRGMLWLALWVDTFASAQRGLWHGPVPKAESSGLPEVSTLLIRYPKAIPIAFPEIWTQFTRDSALQVSFASQQSFSPTRLLRGLENLAC
jgi:hypothetical protein